MTETPEYLNPDQTAQRLPYAALADSIEQLILAHRQGNVDVPDRLHVNLPNDGQLLVMPAGDETLAITKLVSVHPGNREHNLATIQGEVVALRADNGVRLGILDGPTVTGRRTAALSLLAARKLAMESPGVMLVVGAGVQARSHVEALREGLGIGRLLIASRSEQPAKRLAEHAASLGMDAEVVSLTDEAQTEADIIVTATTSTAPFIRKDALQPHTLICAVGAFRAHMAEVQPDAVAACNVVVDDLAGTQAEAGDLIRAAADGTWTWDRAVTLADLLAEDKPKPSGPTLFKSVGHALFDLAAAKLAFRS